MSDPRPADLTAQGPTVDMSRFNTLDVAHGMHGLLILLMNGKPIHEIREKLEPWRNRLAELSDAQERSDEGCGAEGCGPFGCRVCSSAAPSRGQGAGTTVGGANVSCTMTNCGGRCGYPGCQPPAPVASPEAQPQDDVTRGDDGDDLCPACGNVEPCDDHSIVAPPAGPETGWLTMTKETGKEIEEKVARIDDFLFVQLSTDHAQLSLMMREIVALRAALTAATERAAEAEKKRALETKINERLAESIIASESRCAAALTLAREAVEGLDDYNPVMADSYRTKLAAVGADTQP